MRRFGRFLLVALIVSGAVGAIYGFYHYFAHGESSHPHDPPENHRHQPPAQTPDQPNQSNSSQAQHSEQSKSQEKIVGRVVDGVKYEIIIDSELTDLDVAGFPLPYFHMTGRYREKNESKAEAPWQKFLLYLKNANMKYETIEVILDDWRISDGITQGFEHDLPDGVPDCIEYIGWAVTRLRVYHKYESSGSFWNSRDLDKDGISDWFEESRWPFRPDQYNPWVSIPEIEREQLDRIISLTQKKLRLITELINIKELKQFAVKIERERIEQILR